MDIMVIQKKINDITKCLSAGSPMYITVANSEIQLRSLENNKKIEFKTDVYKGENYIPKSVRNSVFGKSILKNSRMSSFLTIDEDNYLVYLNYVSNLDGINKTTFIDQVEEFSWQADEWRLYLDERDRDDLVHVRVK